MPRRKNKHSTKQGTEKRSTGEDVSTIMKTGPTNPGTPLGSLVVFPREIRDEIYRHILAKRYKAFHSPALSFSQCYDEPNPFPFALAEHQKSTGPDLLVLGLSKAIREEAITLLYSEGVFCFYSWNWRNDKPVLQYPNIEIINRMMNIEVFYGYDDGWFEEQTPHYVSDSDIEWFTSHQYGSIAACPLDIFQGDTITRKSIVIDVQLGYDGSYATLMTKSPLFGALKQLTSFKTVTLRLTAEFLCEPRGTHDYRLVEWERAGQWEKLFAGFEPVLSVMSEALEPALGNSVMSRLLYEEDAAVGHRQLIFHPQDHVAACAGHR